MFKNIFSLAGLFAALFIFTGCEAENSNDVAQDRIYCYYDLIYDANQGKTFARAAFKFGNALGTALELSDSSNVRFNGDLLTYQPTFAYYEKEYAGRVDTGSFVWVDADGNSFRNSIDISNNAVEFPASLDTISIAAAFEVFFTGIAVRADEPVIVSIDGTAQNNLEIFTQNNVSATSIIFAANQLQRLGLGNATAFIAREFNRTPTQVTSAGGNIKGKHQGVNKTVVIIP